MPKKIQTILFLKTKWSVEDARAWLDKHDMRSDKVDSGGDHHRFRQFDPSRCSGPEETLTENFPAGVEAVACEVSADSLEMEPRDLLPADQFDDDGAPRKPLAWMQDLDPKAAGDLLGRSFKHDELGLVWRKCYDGVVEKDAADNGRLRFTISTENEDRAGDVVKADGWMLGHYERNPIVLFNHDYGEVAGSPPSQGRTLAISVRGPNVEAIVEFHRKTKFNEELYQMYRGNWMRAASVGFWPLERPTERKTSRGGHGYVFPKNDLLEWSLVAVPMNAEAYQMAARRGVVRAKTIEYLESLTDGTDRQGGPAEFRAALENEALERANDELTGAVARLAFVNRRAGR